jgi:hypothetical protein
MSFAKLINRLEQEIPRRRRSKFDDAWLESIAQLWRGFFTAKRDVASRFDGYTIKAEHLLQTAKRRGILQLCIERGLLPPDATDLHIDEGAAFRGHHHPTLSEPTGNRPMLVSGGAFETHRRRH